MANKRLRIFAGPNGSGKSVLYSYLLNQNYFHRYYYINADEIAASLYTGFSLVNWPVKTTVTDIVSFIRASGFGSYIDSNRLLHAIEVKDNCIRWNDTNTGLSYIAAAIADYLRNEMLKNDSTFACETVFSHPSKLEFMKAAHTAGFKIYLYFIATQDPYINIGRVQNRVINGGHTVPEDKIISRYSKTMENAYNALLLADRSYWFDNSASISNDTYILKKVQS